MRKIIRLILGVALLVLAVKAARAGEVPAHYGKAALPPLSNPAGTIVIIYSHGSGPDKTMDSCQMNRIDSSSGVPAVVHGLYGRSIAGKTVLVDGFCSLVLGEFDDATGTGDHKVMLRSRIIEARARAFIAAGVPARQIFLFGHSMGGWASLMALARNPETANAVVAFAPAFAGKIGQRSPVRQKLRDDYAALITGAGRLPALVYASPEDSFETAATLAFLGQIQEVTLIAVPVGVIDGVPCDSSTTFHTVVRNPCFSQTQGKVLEKFISENLIR
ncbi:alpha/beta hydrolase family protein [Ferrovibrio sp.]|uniref:alpha/beta hydrolase family protein n=1 Tax=Ferrovibrio sp. TaxID=1917215 RepID=UPI0035195DBC